MSLRIFFHLVLWFSGSTILPFSAYGVEANNHTRTIHVMVALCDNKHQGIVKVPSAIGNGQQASTNLYWGAAYGVKTFFKKSKEWKLISTQKINDTIVERLLFKHATESVYLVADAYDGRYIKTATIDLIRASYGLDKKTIMAGSEKIGIGGNADVLAYCGHDGLMDFDLPQEYTKADNKTRSIIILACYSKSYFSPHLQAAGIQPLVWSRGLMSPEAYTLHAALSAWIQSKSAANIREAAATAYSTWQHCSLKAARNLLVNGW